MTTSERITKLSADLKSKLYEIENDKRQNLVDLSIDDRKKAHLHIENTPSLDWSICVHVIGEARAMKSSFILDLYDNSILREYLNIIDDSAHDHTACPCMIIPTNNMKESIKVIKVNIFDFEDTTLINDIDTFRKFYALPKNKEKISLITGGYFLKVFLPISQCKFSYNVVEYPGIDSKEYQSEEKKSLYQRMEGEFTSIIEKIPGFVVACFEKKIDVPKKHPLDTFVKNYKKSFGKTKQHLPLIFSFNGNGAVRTYCSGNSDLIDLLDNNFSIHTEFDTRIQLINPNYLKYPIVWSEKTKNQKSVVNEWINRFSNYHNYQELRKNIQDDGGLTYSRKALANLLEDTTLLDNIGYIFHYNWLKIGKSILASLVQRRKNMDDWEDVKKISQHLRKKLVQYADEPYISVKEIYNEEMNRSHFNDCSKKEFWIKIISDYYIQLIPKDICPNIQDAEDRILEVSEEILNNILVYYSNNNEIPCSLNFFSDEDMHNALLTIMNFYLPNQILKNNKQLLTAMIGI